MKRLCFAVAALAMLVTSCAKDDTTIVVPEGETLVSFKVNTPEINTRYGEGTTANQLFYAVYQNGTLLENISALTADKAVAINISAEVQIALVKGIVYDILFWAQAEDAPYTFDGAKVTIDYANLAANEEAYDAFFRNYRIETGTTTSHYVELYRPFAQLNIATGDTEAAINAGFDVAKTAITIETCTVLDLATGEASEPQEITFAMNSKAEGTYQDFDIIAMNYLLVNSDKELIDLAFNVEDNAGKATSLNFENVPIQRNYRTYILGNLLTTEEIIDVVIIPAFGGDYETAGFVGAKIGDVVYETLEEAIVAAYDGDIIELSYGEFVFPMNITTNGTRAGERRLRFLGQGEAKTTVSFGTEGVASDGGLNCYADNLSLSFRNMKIVSPSVGTKHGGFGRVASVDFKDCTYEGQYYAYGDTKFENCTIDPQTGYAYTGEENVDFIDCTFNCSKGKGLQVYADGTNFSSVINIKNCTFTAAEIGYTWDEKPVTAIDINSNGGKFLVNIDNTTATGFGTGLYSGSDLWNIKGGAANITVMIDGEIAPICVGTAERLAEVLTMESENISVVLTNDIDLPISSLGSITAGSGEYKLGGENTKNITIDLGENKLNITTTYWSAIGAKNNEALITIKNGSMTSTGNSAGTWNAWDLRFSNCNYAFENVVFEKAVALDNVGKTTSMTQVTITDTHDTDTYGLWITAEGQTVTLDDCVMDMTPASDGRGIKIDEQYVDAPAKVTLNVSNTVFKTEEKSAIIVKSAAGAEINASNIDITGVAADTEYAVWVDEGSLNSYDLVVVNGCSKRAENEVAIADQDVEALRSALSQGAYAVMQGNMTANAEETGPTCFTQTNGGVIDGNGYWMYAYAASNNPGNDSAIRTSGGTIKNLNIWYAWKGIYIVNGPNPSKLYLDNVTVNPSNAVNYAIHCDQGAGKGLEAANCKFYTVVAYAASIGDVKFTNCEFGANTKYVGNASCNAYAPTEFVGCAFEEGFTVATYAACTFEDCTLGGVALTEANIGELVSEVANATIK